MDERLAVYAAERGGVFCWVDAQRFCVSARRLSDWVEGGEVVRIRRNAYVVGAVWQSADRKERERLSVMAVVRSRATWAASHQCTFVLHGLPLRGVDLAMFDVAAPVSRLREQARVRRHPDRDLPDPDTINGTPSVPLPWAIAQVALRDGVTPALVGLDHALHQQLTCLEDVERAGERLAMDPSTDATAIARLLSLADSKCESPGETLTRLLLLDLGHQPVSQVVIRDRQGRFVGRVDFLIRGKVVVEFDGAVKYSGDDVEAVIAAEKERERRLRALGFAVVRLGWADVYDPADFARRLREALSSCERAG